METWDAIRARRNVRTYLPDPVPAADLDRIAEAGWRAPSASNRQHWNFIIVTDRDQLQALSTVWQGARHIAGAAAAIALVLPQPADERTKVVNQYDLGQATYAIMLAAADLGIGTGHSSVGDQEQGARDPRRSRRPRRGLHDRRGLPGGPPAQAHRQAEPPAVRRGSPARSLVGTGEATLPF